MIHFFAAVCFIATGSFFAFAYVASYERFRRESILLGVVGLWTLAGAVIMEALK